MRKIICIILTLLMAMPMFSNACVSVSAAGADVSRVDETRADTVAPEIIRAVNEPAAPLGEGADDEGGSYFGDEYDARPLLILGESVEVPFDGTELSGVYRFSPEADGIYVFYSTGYADTLATLFDSEGYELGSDDDSGDEMNFLIEQSLEGGKTYFLFTDRYSYDNETFAVTVVRLPEITGLSLALTRPDASLVEGVSDGFWGSYYDETAEDYLPYYSFSENALFRVLTGTIEYDDGSSETLTSESRHVIITYDCRNWTAGGESNTVLVSCDYSIVSAEINVPVISFAEFASTIPTVGQGETVTVDYDLTRESGMLAFTPDRDGWYEFGFESSFQIFAELYDSDLESIDSVRGYDLIVLQKLEGGKTYVLSTGSYYGSTSGKIEVSARRLPDITGISVALKSPDAVLVQDWTGGYWSDYYDEDLGEYVRYYRFYADDIFSILTVTAELEDGTSAVLKYNDKRLTYSFDCENWTVGGENNAVSVSVRQSSLTADVNVPVVSFSDYISLCPVLTTEEPVTVNYTGTEFSGMLSFTPETDGYYEFTSSGNFSRAIRLCDSNGDLKTTTIEFGSYETGTFFIELEGGMTYVMFTCITTSNVTGEYVISAARKPGIADISIKLKDPDAALVQGLSGGYWSYSGGYYYYETEAVLSLLTITVEYDDGTSGVITGYGDDYYFSFSPRLWTPGGENNTFRVISEYSDVSASINVPVISLGDYASGCPALTEEEPVAVNRDGTELSGFVTFTPGADGWYEFSISGDYYKNVYLYDYDGKSLKSNSGQDFTLTCRLEAGETYVLRSRSTQSDAGQSTVSVSRLPEITGLTLSLRSPDSALVEGWSSGYRRTYYDYDLNQYVEYYYYYDGAIFRILTITAEFEDGTSCVLDYEDPMLSYSYNCTSWTQGGEDNTVTVRSNYSDASASISVPIVQFSDYLPLCPVITAGDPATFQYDGSRLTGTTVFVPETNGWYNFSISADTYLYGSLYGYNEGSLESLKSSYGWNKLSFTARLEAGKTYVLSTQSDYGEAVRFTVSVTRLPEITGLSLTLNDPDSVLVEGWSDGGWEEGDNGAKYYNYSVDTVFSILTVTAEYDDGSSGVLDYYDPALSYSYTCADWVPGGESNTVTVSANYTDVSASANVPVLTFEEFILRCPTVRPGEPVTVDYAGNPMSGVVVFTPEQSGLYEIYSTGTYDTFLTLCDSEGNETAYDDDSGSDRNFRLTLLLEEGKTYYLQTQTYNPKNSGTYVVHAERLLNITGLSIALSDPDSALVEGWSGGEWYYNDYDVKYYKYYSGTTFSILTITAEYEDGSSGVLEYNDPMLSYSFNCDGWTPGGEKNTVTVRSNYSDASATINVPVITFADYIAARPVLTTEDPVTANFDGTERSGLMTFTAETDGWYKFSVRSNYYNYVLLYLYDNGSAKQIASSDSDNASLTYRLTAGKTYVLRTRQYPESGMGEYTASVTRLPDITRLTLSLNDPDFALVEGWSEGRWVYVGSDAAFYDFDYDEIFSNLTITAEYEDGTSGEIDYYDFRLSHSYDCADWTPGGNGNTVTVSVRYTNVSASANVPVVTFADYIAGRPVLTTEEPVTAFYDGSERSGMMSFTPEKNGWYTFTVSADCYVNFDLFDFVNGSIGSMSGYGGTKISFTQRLEGGKTYAMRTLSTEGTSAKFTVSVTRLPDITRLTLSPVDPDSALVEGRSGGWWFDNGAGVRYYSYPSSSVFSLLTITAEYEDGTSDEIDYYDSRLTYSYDCAGWAPGGADNTVTVSARYTEVSASANVPVITFADFVSGCPVLTTEDPVTVIYDGTERSGMMTFTPAADGWYEFSTYGSSLGYTSIFDLNGNYISDDLAHLEGGKTYALFSGPGYAGTGETEFSLSVRRLPDITRLTLSPVDPDFALVEGWSEGKWVYVGSDAAFYDFDYAVIFSNLTITAEYEDGTSDEIDYYNFRLSYSYNCAGWTPGGDGNTVTVSARYTDVSASANVPVITLADHLSALPSIKEDDPVVVDFDGTERSSWMTFTPAADGWYEFSAYGNYNLYVGLYRYDDGSMSFTESRDGSDISFKVRLEAGKPYLLRTQILNGGAGKFTVSVTRQPDVTGLTLSLNGPDSALVEEWSRGDWEYNDYGNAYYYYYYSSAIFPLMTITAEYADGTSGVLDYDDPMLTYSYNCVGWARGGDSNTVTVTARYTDVSASINVPITTFDVFAPGWPTITEGVPVTVDYARDITDGVFVFTPEQSGLFDIYSTGEFDTYLIIRDSSGNRITYDDDSGEGANFRSVYRLEGGKTYYLQTRLYYEDKNGTYTVHVEFLPDIARLSVTLSDPGAMLVEGWGDGYWTGDYEYSRYYYYRPSEVFSILTITAEFADGTKAVLSYDDPRISYLYSCMNWKPGGNRNTVTVTAKNAGASVSVNVPVVSFDEFVSGCAILTVDEDAAVRYDGTARSGIVAFTPETTGIYHIYSTGGYSTHAYLCYQSGETMLICHYGGFDENFRIDCRLQGGTTYYLFTSAQNVDSAGYTVCAETEKGIKSISLSLNSPEAALVTGEGGKWNCDQPDNEYYEFLPETIFSIITVTAEYEDGTTETVDYRSGRISFYYNCAQWAAGGEANRLTAYDGVSGAWASINVPVSAAASEHNLVHHDGKEPTCTEIGWYAYDTCTDCDYTTYREIPALGHNFGPWTAVGAITCTEGGTEERVCSRCGEKETRTFDPTGHNFESWTVKVPATCTEKGIEERVCSRCGATEQRDIPAKGHDYENTVVAPTCTEQGYTRHVCRVCGDTYVDATVRATGHAWGPWTVVTPATETEDGLERRVCASDPAHVEERIIPKNSHVHDLTEVRGTEATCTADGNITYYVCAGCGRYFADSEGAEGINAEDTVIPALGHNFGSWTTAAAATCTENGSEERVCSRCGEKESRPVAATGHNYVAEATAPTCTALGFTTHTCSKCGDKYVDTYVDALGHDFGADGKAATCSRCGAKNPSVPTIKFKDVPDNAYYKTAVDWAVANGITSGTSSTTFSPNAGCTRGQVVTFLWRAAGQPEPAAGTKNPFRDVKESDYVYTAVLWAVANGITSGTSSTTFSPKAVCTRGQIVTFLWRAEKEPKPKNPSNPFSDVKAKDYFHTAVLWAVEKGITLGTDKTHFSPSATCTRGQVVTFLYRDMG